MIMDGSYTNKVMEEESKDNVTNHLNFEDCTVFLTARNPGDTTAVSLLEAFIQDSLDPFLSRLVGSLQHDLNDIVIMLRTFGVLDQSDQERIANKYVNTTTAEEITALVDILNTKDPHSYWYFVHSLEKRHPSLFQDMHGQIVCCVCEEVKEKTKEISTNVTEQNTATEQPNTKLLSELSRNVKQLTERFRCLEQNCNSLVENISQRLRAEIQDVLPQPQADYEIGGHTNMGMLNRLREKICRGMENLRTSQIETTVNMENENSDCEKSLKEIISKPPQQLQKNSSQEQVQKPNHTYEDLWINFEGKFSEILSHFNPAPVMERGLDRVLQYWKCNVYKSVAGLATCLCITVYGPYLLVYGPWTTGPMPLFG